MKQRLALARTLLPDPEVLLLDEPARGLDPLGRMELWKLLLQLHEAGKAVLISSHLLSELSNFCNKTALVERGKLVAFGTGSGVEQPTHRRMFMKWRAGDDKALRVLQSDHGVSEIAASGQSATFTFNGGADLLHELLRLLIQHEVHVTEWRSLDEARPLAVSQSAAATVM